MSNNLPQVIEYSNQRILTTKQIAERYGTDVAEVIKNFNNNKENYTEGKHYFLLKGATLKAFKDYIQNLEVVDKRAPSLYLWTKEGALLIAKSLNTPESWEAYKQLIDGYYETLDSYNSLLDEHRRALAELEKMKQQSAVPQHKFTDMLAERAKKNLARVPDGYFAVLPHLFYQLWTLERLTGSLDEDAQLEISVGKCWRRYAIEHLHLSPSQMIQYSHILANGLIKPAWAYTDIKAGDFYKWLWTIYFPEYFPAYVEYRKDKLTLPAPKQQKRLKGGNS